MTGPTTQAGPPGDHLYLQGRCTRCGVSLYGYAPVRRRKCGDCRKTPVVKVPRVKGPPPDLAAINRRIALYRSGLSLRRVAAREGVSMQRIHQTLARHAPHLMRRAGGSAQSTGLRTGGRR